ncbi:MAG: hypothetical protein HKN44_04085 [Ilumatobacter sp.]|nr:hypothetical protein [Ilumatobacter sp.]
MNVPSAGGGELPPITAAGGVGASPRARATMTSNGGAVTSIEAARLASAAAMRWAVTTAPPATQ